VHRDHRAGADELAATDRVVAIHRVVAADRQQGDVDGLRSAISLMSLNRQVSPAW
jgi:hypothetical protein